MSLRRFVPPSAPSVVLVLAVTLLAASPEVRAQGEAGPPDDPLEGFAEEVSVEIVNVEVWVTDRQGRPVPALTRDDFELFEDGEPVEITNFAAYGEAAPSGSAEVGTGEPAAAPAPGTAPSEGGEDALHLAVLVDDWNLRPEDRARVLEDLRTFLTEHVRPGDRVMVAVHDRALQLVQGFTADSRALVRSLDAVERGAPSGVALRNERRGALEAIREAWERAAREVQLVPSTATETGPAGGVPGPCVTGWGEMENAARSYAAAVEGHVQRSAGAVASLAEILSGVPGRKVLLYVGNGLEQQAGAELFHFLGEICPDRQSEVSSYFSIYDMTWLFEEVARRANAGRITLYALEAEPPRASEDIALGGPQGAIYRPEPPATGGDDLEAGGVTIPQASPGGRGGMQSFGQSFRPSAGVRRQAELNREDSLAYMARETGGRAVLNAADFRDDFERIATDLRTHYSLGFSSSHRGDGRSHRVEVKLKDGDGYRVRHRRSYVARPPELRMAERIRGVAQFGEAEGPGSAGTAVGLVNPLGIRIETGEATAVAGGGHRVPLRLWVPLSKVTLLPGDGTRRGRLRVMMAVGDAVGNLGPVRQKLVDVEVRGTEAGEAPEQEKLVEVQLDLDGERHVVALGVRDEVGGDTSYLRHEVRIDAAPQARLEP